MRFYFLFALLPWLAAAIPRPDAQAVAIRQATSSYWVAQIQRQGSVAFGSDPTYKVFRNVKDYGAVGKRDACDISFSC